MAEVPPEVKKGREMLDEVAKGEWPNFLREARKTRYPVDLYGTALSMKRDLFTTGGYVSVPGAPTGILMRVTSRPDIGENTNVVRVLIPSGNFVTSDMLDKYCDFADDYGVGMLHALTTGQDIEIPGIPKDRIKEFVTDFRAAGMEIGSTGDAFRTTTTCVGSALCEHSCYDTMGARDSFYDRFNEYAKYPTFPHKFKVKMSGCPLDCARVTQKADFGIVGSWEGAPTVRQEALSKLEEDALREIVASCPTGAITRTNGGISIKGEDCTQCMACIRTGKGALAPGEKKKFLIYVGGKLRGKKGPMSSKMLTTRDSIDSTFDLLEKVVDAWSEHAARKERLGDMIFRLGMKGFLDLINMKAEAHNVRDLRTNVFYAVSGEERKKIPEDVDRGRTA